MSDISRRNLLGAAAASGGFASTTVLVDAFTETQQPPFGPAPPPLAGPELPSFRFALGALASKAFDGGTAKEATVDFPVFPKNLPAS